MLIYLYIGIVSGIVYWEFKGGGGRGVANHVKFPLRY